MKKHQRDELPLPARGERTSDAQRSVGPLELDHESCNLCIMHNMKDRAGMVRVSSAEFQRNIGRYQDMALVQPVAVTRNGRDRTVMISVEEYHRLKRRDRQVLALQDFTDADIATLEQTRAAESSKEFDDELKS